MHLCAQRRHLQKCKYKVNLVVLSFQCSPCQSCIPFCFRVLEFLKGFSMKKGQGSLILHPELRIQPTAIVKLFGIFHNQFGRCYTFVNVQRLFCKKGLIKGI